MAFTIAAAEIKEKLSYEGVLSIVFLVIGLLAGYSPGADK